MTQNQTRRTEQSNILKKYYNRNKSTNTLE